jgi:ribonuclease BN (tRNA processing enzyme)
LDQEDYETLEQEKEISASALKILNSHSAIHKVVDVAIAGAVEQLILIHLNPKYTISRLGKMEKTAQKRSSNTHLARDGVVIKNTPG